LSPAPGYRFDSDELPDVFFNASSEYVDGDYTRVSKAGSLYCYTFDFEAEESAAVVFGDINGDGTANNKDVVALFKYLSGGDVKVNEDALDCNGDGQINNKDAGLEITERVPLAVETRPQDIEYLHTKKIRFGHFL
jgi:GTP cyclohydrolase II